MGDVNSERIIFSPLRVKRPDDIFITIPTQEEYKEYQNALRYNRYVMHSLSFDKFPNIYQEGVKNFFWGQSAEDLAERFGKYISLENSSPLIEINFSAAPFRNFSLEEKNKSFLYECSKLNDEEKVGFLLGLEKCRELWERWNWNPFDSKQQLLLIPLTTS